MEPVAPPAPAAAVAVPAAEDTGERPLAYVETIRELRPIPGADVIEVRKRSWRVSAPYSAWRSSIAQTTRILVTKSSS